MGWISYQIVEHKTGSRKKDCFSLLFIWMDFNGIVGGWMWKIVTHNFICYTFPGAVCTASIVCIVPCTRLVCSNHLLFHSFCNIRCVFSSLPSSIRFIPNSDEKFAIDIYHLSCSVYRVWHRRLGGSRNMKFNQDSIKIFWIISNYVDELSMSDHHAPSVSSIICIGRATTKNTSPYTSTTDSQYWIISSNVANPIKWNSVLIELVYHK